MDAISTRGASGVCRTIEVLSSFFMVFALLIGFPPPVFGLRSLRSSEFLEACFVFHQVIYGLAIGCCITEMQQSPRAIWKGIDGRMLRTQRRIHTAQSCIIYRATQSSRGNDILLYNLQIETGLHQFGESH